MRTLDIKRTVSVVVLALGILSSAVGAPYRRPPSPRPSTSGRRIPPARSSTLCGSPSRARRAATSSGRPSTRPSGAPARIGPSRWATCAVSYTSPPAPTPRRSPPRPPRTASASAKTPPPSNPRESRGPPLARGVGVIPLSRGSKGAPLVGGVGSIPLTLSGVQRATLAGVGGHPPPFSGPRGNPGGGSGGYPPTPPLFSWPARENPVYNGPDMVINVDPNLIVLGPFVLSWHGLFSAVGLGHRHLDCRPAATGHRRPRR